MEQTLTVREIQKKDISSVVGYWKNASIEHLMSMGIDVSDLSKFEVRFLSLGPKFLY